VAEGQDVPIPDQAEGQEVEVAGVVPDHHRVGGDPLFQDAK